MFLNSFIHVKKITHINHFLVQYNYSFFSLLILQRSNKKKIIFLLQCQQSAIHSKYFDSLRGKKIYFWKLHSGILGLTMSFS